MHSVRLDEKLEARLEEAVERTGISASEIIRRGVRRECDKLLAEPRETLRDVLAPFIGSLRSRPRKGWKWSARDSSTAFTEGLRRKKRR